jgi:hypothetical protein
MGPSVSRFVVLRNVALDLMKVAVAIEFSGIVPRRHSSHGARYGARKRSSRLSVNSLRFVTVVTNCMTRVLIGKSERVRSWSNFAGLPQQPSSRGVPHTRYNSNAGRRRERSGRTSGRNPQQQRYYKVEKMLGQLICSPKRCRGKKDSRTPASVASPAFGRRQ